MPGSEVDVWVGVVLARWHDECSCKFTLKSHVAAPSTVVTARISLRVTLEADPVACPVAVKLMLDEEPLAPDGNEAKGAGVPPPASPAAPAAKQPDLLSPDVAVEGIERVAAAPSAADEDDAGDGTWTHVDDDID